MIEDFEIDKIYKDEFGRVSGVFKVDKPVGVGSHDMVYEYRRKLGTKKVGHAGALDPFASGLLIILAGKATKLSDHFLTLDKTYEAEILFGISTDSGDTEGKVLKVEKDPLPKISEDKLLEALKEFQPSYNQYVPVFSSVKVEGQKLRVLARKYERFEIEEPKSPDDKKTVKFYNGDDLKKEIKLPSKEVKIYEIEPLALGTVNYEVKEETPEGSTCTKLDFPTAKIRIKCSKGTYIRQLAEDIGEKLGTPAMLINLRRVQIGDIVL